jgi:hypothetical protein
LVFSQKVMGQVKKKEEKMCSSREKKKGASVRTIYSLKNVHISDHCNSTLRNLSNE